MHEAIIKANALIEALSYIHKFRGRIVVVKLGGSLMETDQTQKELLKGIVFLARVGMRPILIHGGGKCINAALAKVGIEPSFVQGRRYTDERTLSIVEHTLVHEINDSIVATLEELGAEAMGLHSLGSCVLFGEQVRLKGPEGRQIDIGLVGDITRVNAHLLGALCEAGTIPVIAPVAIDRAGGKLNVNADTAAGQVAAAVKAEKLVMMSDTHGIRTDRDDPESQVTRVTEAQITEMIDSGIIDGGMLPKVQACITALDGGVGRAHIIDGSVPQAVLLEIYTDDGIGTLITKE